MSKKQKKLKTKIMIYFIIFIVIILLFLLYKIVNKITYLHDDSTYFTTWATAIHIIEAPSKPLKGNSLRQIIKVSSGGEKIRLKFSNIFGENKLELKNVYIADIISKSEINKKTMQLLTFNGKNNIVIESGEEIYSDITFYPLKALSDIAVSIFFGSVPKELSGHSCSLTYSYIETGNKVQKKKFNIKNKIDQWYFISAIEISSKSPKKTIVCFGDSITDGVVFRGDIRINYPDILFSRLHQNNEALNLSIVNEGINADRLIDQGIKRYEHDVLNIKGVAYIIVLYGVNDLNVIDANSTEIISGYKKIIKKAHERNILIYAGTITPFANYKSTYLWNRYKEKGRKEVNEWIRTTKPKDGGFDAFIDFDKLLRDPKNKTKLFKKYDSKDGIHPNYEGYKKMVKGIIDLSLFSKNPSFKNY